MRRVDRRAGFALIEVLAALVITAAMVAVVLPFGANLLTRWWSGQPDIEQADDVMQAVARLGDDLAQAVPLTITADASRTKGFRSDTKRLDFIRPSLGAAARTGLDVVTYTIVTNQDGDRLLRSSHPYRSDEGLPAPGQPAGAGVAILEGPLTLRFGTVGPDGRALELWQGRKDMPRRVELALRPSSSVPRRAGGVAPPSKIVFPLGAGGE